MEEALRLFTASTIDSANTDLALANKLSEEEREEVNKSQSSTDVRLKITFVVAYNAVVEWPSIPSSTFWSPHTVPT
eukprot:5063454-Amphidinium_carterae.1